MSYEEVRVVITLVIVLTITLIQIPRYTSDSLRKSSQKKPVLVWRTLGLKKGRR